MTENYYSKSETILCSVGNYSVVVQAIVVHKYLNSQTYKLYKYCSIQLAVNFNLVIKDATVNNCTLKLDLS